MVADGLFAHFMWQWKYGFSTGAAWTGLGVGSCHKTKNSPHAMMAE